MKGQYGIYPQLGVSVPKSKRSKYLMLIGVIIMVIGLIIGYFFNFIEIAVSLLMGGGLLIMAVIMYYHAKAAEIYAKKTSKRKDY